MMWDYIKAHWQGRLGLLRSCLLNGLAGYLLVLTVGLIPAWFGFVDMGLLVYAGLIVLWWIWAGVGIVRCGGRYAFNKENTLVRRFGGVAAILGGGLISWLVGGFLVGTYTISLKPFF